MTLQPKEWVNTCNRFVAYMDIMGFKDMVFRTPHNEILTTLESFEGATIDPIKTDAERRLHDLALGVMYTATGGIEYDLQETMRSRGIRLRGGTGPYVRPVFFSDSILLITSDESLESIDLLFFLVQWIMWMAVFSYRIPLKGAIAHGEQTADFEKFLHFGKPLIDAYELQNEVLLYGVVLHHSTERFLTDTGIMEKFHDVHIRKYQTPLKGGIINHYVLDWLDLDERLLNYVLPELYGMVSGSPRRYVDNTAEYARWLIKSKNIKTK